MVCSTAAGWAAGGARNMGGRWNAPGVCEQGGFVCGGVCVGVCVCARTGLVCDGVCACVRRSATCTDKCVRLRVWWLCVGVGVGVVGAGVIVVEDGS